MSLVPGLGKRTLSLELAYRDIKSPLLREKFLEKEIDTALELARGQVHFELRQFFNTHIPLEVEETPYEGNHTADSIRFWKSFIHCLQNEELSFLLSTITPEAIKVIFDALDDVEITDQITSNLTEDQYSNAAKKLQEYILNNLKSRKWVYQLKGYRAGSSNLGHSLPCRYELDKIIRVHLLNQGDGAEMHPPITFTTTQIYHPFRYPPIEIEPEVFQETGHALFMRDIQLRNDSPTPEKTPYSAIDVYGPLMILGQVKSYVKEVSTWKSKPQLGMTCADKAIKLVIKDLLIELSVSKKDRTRLFCQARLLSFLAAFHHIPTLDLECLSFFERALQSFAVTLEIKMEDFLTLDEVLFCQGVIQRLQTTVAQRKKELNLQETKPFPFNGSLDFRATLPEIEIKKPSSLSGDGVVKVKMAKSYPPSSKKVIKHARRSEPCPQITLSKSPAALYECLKDIQKIALRLCEKADSIIVFSFLHAIFLQLPCPKIDKDPFWELVPKEEIVPVLKVIEDLASLAMTSQSQAVRCTNEEYGRRLALVYSAYCIADKLARLEPETHLNGYHSQFWPKNAKSPFIPSGEDNWRFFEIKEYLTELEKEHPTPLFYFSYPFKISSQIKYLRFNISGWKSDCLSYLKFLKQFYSKAREKGLDPHENYSTTEYKELWLDKEKKYLPQEFHCLARISRLAAITSFDYRRLPHKNLRKHPLFIEDKEKELNTTFVLFNTETSFCSPSEFTSDNGALDFLWSYFHDAKLTTNRAVCLVHGMGDWKSAYLRILAEKEMQVRSTICWLKNHLNDLHSSKEKWLQALERLLFEPGVLHKELQETPQLWCILRSFFWEALECLRMKPNHLDKYLHLIRIFFAVESHIKFFQKEAYECFEVTKVHQELKKLYEKDLSSDVGMHLLLPLPLLPL